MSTIFISHSSSDNAIASELGERLAQQNHHSVFLDLDPEKGIVAGQSWEQTLYRKLRACRAVIALVTDNYLDSQWCFAEIALARMEGKHIIALQVDPLSEGAKLPAILTERQFIDLRTNGEEGYRRLWKGLKEQDLLGVTGEWDPKKPPYLGLSAYHEEHAPVFFGREDESRAGLELLARGAPGLIMVLGASGSGKSSLVLAGMLPRLRCEVGQWLVVHPFRPGRDPYLELAESIVQTWRRYAPEHAARVGSAEQIRARLEAWTPRSSVTAASAAPQSESAEAAPAPGADQRVARLIQHIEELRNDPPAPLQERLRHFLDWSLDDLQRISGDAVPSAAATAAGGAGTTPLVDLARDLRHASGQRNACVLLIVDQFEELLGREEADDKVNRFLALLRASLEAEHTPLMALGTMRSDFLGVFQRSPALRGIDFESLSLGPMRVDGMRRVIEEPAKLGALELETGLADRLIKDTETPDALPLLSFTLSALWRDCRQDGKLDIREYEELGGLNGAIAGEADALLAAAKKEGREEELRRGFLRMARLTEEGGYARQPVAWDSEELRPVHPILERFVERRLLVTHAEGGARMVEVAHEALFRSWTPLKTWLDNNRAELLLRQQITRDAKAWQESKRAKENLWRGGRLLEARELVRKGQLAEPALEFVRASLRRRKVQWATLAGTTLAVITVLAGFLVFALLAAETAKKATVKAVEAETATKVALAQAEEEKDKSNRQLSLSLAAQSKLNPTEHPQQSLLLAVEAVKAWKDKTGRHNLRAEAALRASLDHIGGLGLSGHEGVVTSVAFSPDRRWLVTGSRGDNQALLWDCSSGTPEEKSIELNGHEGPVSAVAFSRDKHWLVTGSEDGTARLWNLNAADPSKGSLELKGHEGYVSAVAFSPDNHWLATGSDDNTARLWDLTSGDPTQKPLVLQGHKAFQSILEGGIDKHFAFSVAFSPDNHWLVTGGGDGQARLWDLTSSDPSANSVPLKGGGSQPPVVASFSPDGRWLVTGGSDWSVQLFDFKAGDFTQTPLVLKGHGHQVYTVAFSPDNHWLVTTDYDGASRIWDLTSDDPAQNAVDLHERTSSGSVAISPDSQWLVTGSGGDNSALLWDLTSGKSKHILKGHDGAVSAAAFSPDNRWLVTGSRDKTARLWDLTSDKPAQAPREPLILEGHDDRANAVAFSPNNRWLAVGASGNARLWDITSGDRDQEPLVLEGHERRVGAVAFSPDNHWLVTTDYIGKTLLWDVTSDDPAAQNRVLEESYRNIASPAAEFSPDKHWLATASRDKTAHLWDFTSDTPGQDPLVLQGHDADVIAVAFSSDSHWLVTGSKDKTARIWDLTSSDLTRDSVVLAGHREPVAAVAFSPDNHWLVTGSYDGTARLWDFNSGNPAQEPFVLAGHTYKAGYTFSVWAMAFSPDSHWLVTGRGDPMARLWDLTSSDPAEKPLLLTGHKEFVSTVAFSPDNHWLATGSFDNTARLWDLTSANPAREPLVLKGHDGRVSLVAFSSDNRWVVTGSYDDTVRFWKLDFGDIFELARRIIGRNFLQDEWEELFPGTPYRRTFDQFPAGK